MAEFYENRVILCCNNQQPVSSTLFELGNLQRSSEYHEVAQQVVGGKIKNRDRFAYEYEKIEYGTCQDHNDRLQQCIKEKGWTAKRESYPRISWDKWWTYYTEDSKHAEEYRKEFDKMMASVSENMLSSIFNKIRNSFTGSMS